MAKFRLSIPFICLSLCILSRASESPVVKTNYGPVRGKTVQISTENDQIDMFLGVPFAKPPKPVPPDHWTLKETLEYQSSCLPLIIPERSAKFLYWTEKYDEDCLYLNIFSPHKSNYQLNIDTPKLPVLVLIHGGIFLFSSSFRYSNYIDIGQKYVNQGIIVVTLTHRLGVFGFASTGDYNLPGNLGLWDLTEALKFVNENIGYFGGDPQQVTLYGYSAGSALIGALSLSPNSADYFSQAAQFSSSILSGRGTGAHVVESTLELAQSVNCQSSDTLKMKACLKALKTQDLIFAIKEQALLTSSKKQFGTPTFGPLVDHDFFQGIDYTDLMRIRAKNSKPTMIGYNNLDGFFHTLLMNKNFTYFNLAVPYEHLKSFGYEDFKAFAELEDQIVEFYVGHKSADKNATFYLEQYTLLVSDLLFTVPILWEARVKAVNNWPLYLYVITYASSSYHTKDDDYLFKTLTQTKEFSKSDQKLEEQLVNSLRNFVKHGDPSFGSVKWPLADAKTFRRMRFDLPNAVIEDSTEDFRRVEFWDGLIKLTDYNLVRDIFVNKSNKNEL
uniref:Carboxylic ester hydrolase n=1 Tax=Ditylenchus dipsaci TaxID=166011 RepID=A0A915EHU4_9BILA